MGEWRVYMRRDGKTERTVVLTHVGRRIDFRDADGRIHIYEYTAIMPATRELFADHAGDAS